MVERLFALLGGVDGDAEVFLELLLADELVEPARAEGGVLGVFLTLRCAGCDALGSRTTLLVEYVCYLETL